MTYELGGWQAGWRPLPPHDPAAAAPPASCSLLLLLHLLLLHPLLLLHLLPILLLLLLPILIPLLLPILSGALYVMKRHLPMYVTSRQPQCARVPMGSLNGLYLLVRVPIFSVLAQITWKMIIILL